MTQLAAELTASLWSAESEGALLGALLLSPQRAYDAAQPIEAGHFFDQRHAKIFGAIERLLQREAVVDVITIFETLRDAGQADVVGGLAYLNALAEAAPSAAGAAAYARKIRQLAEKRALRDLLDDALDQVTAAGADPVAMLDTIGTSLRQLEASQLGQAPRQASTLAMRRTQHWENLASGKVLPGWPTGFARLDRMLNGGLRPGQLVILAARPAVGKSSFALQIALRSALRTLYLSQEMADCEVIDRATANLAGIDYADMQSGRLSDHDWARIAGAIERMQHTHVDDQPALKLAEIRTKCRSISGLKVVVLDYLQLCAGSVGAGANRNAEVEQISRGLKQLAKDQNVCVIALSQLNRAVESRSVKRPMLADLRDSGSLEQDADVVAFLWPVSQAADGTKLIGLGIDKNRQGRCGEIALRFDGAHQRWVETDEPLHESSPVRSRPRGMADD
jgi:replicative DNA helicase